MAGLHLSLHPLVRAGQSHIALKTGTHKMVKPEEAHLSAKLLGANVQGSFKFTSTHDVSAKQTQCKPTNTDMEWFAVPALCKIENKHTLKTDPRTRFFPC